MEMRMRLHEEVKLVPAADARPDAGELPDDELEAVVGGLERAWLPGDAARAAGR